MDFFQICTNGKLKRWRRWRWNQISNLRSIGGTCKRKNGWKGGRRESSLGWAKIELRKKKYTWAGISMSEVVGPTELKLQGLGSPICGPWMQSTKKGKSITEKSNFWKVHILLDSKTIKIVHRFWCEKSVLPFLAKKLGF